MRRIALAAFAVVFLCLGAASTAVAQQEEPSNDTVQLAFWKCDWVEYGNLGQVVDSVWTPIAQELVDEGTGLPPDQANPLAQQIYKYITDEQLIIGTARRSPLVQGIQVVNADLENVPGSWANDTLFDTPFPAYPEQFFFR